MNRKIVTSLVSSAAMLAVVVGATFAFFSDSGTSSANTFSSGTLNMQLSDGNQEDLDSVTGTWGLNSAPGDIFTGDLRITNVGSVSANHVELKFTNGVTEAVSGPGTVSTVPMDRVLEITTLGWDSDGNGSPETDLLPGVVDTNGNTIKDLDDLETQVADDFDNLSFGGTQTADHVLRIAGRFSPTLGVDQHQGDSVNMTLDVTMNQDSSQ